MRTIYDETNGGKDFGLKVTSEDTRRGVQYNFDVTMGDSDGLPESTFTELTRDNLMVLASKLAEELGCRLVGD